MTAASALGLQLLMPRVFYSDPEVTSGWKARWHLSVLVPLAVVSAVALTNDVLLKDSFKGFRPGCDATNQGGPGCGSYGMMSTHAVVAGGALGHGAAVFLFDTLSWNHRRVHVGALLGDVGVPLVLGVITAVGRKQGTYESTAQIAAGGLTGLGFGFVSGLAYALLQRPECGYTGSLVCW